MSVSWRYGFPERDKHLVRYAELAGLAFNVPFEEVEPKIRAFGSRIVRVLEDPRRVAGGALLYPMGQWFAGRCVPTTGVAAVAIASEMRGRGLAAQLMRAILNEIHEKEIPLSTLYPAIVSLYRRAGYELAGARHETRLALRTFDIRERALEVRELGEQDRRAVNELYARRVKSANGPLDRAGEGWRKVLDIWRSPMVRQGIWDGERLEAAVAYPPKLKDGALTVAELVAGSPAGARRLLAYLGAQRSTVEACVFHGPAADPLLDELQPFSYQSRLFSRWMLRIVDVARALEARGYAPGARGTAQLEIRDDILPHNAGRFVLEVAEGSARVRPGGRGLIKIDIRGLAALYSAYLPAGELREFTPYLEASPAQVAVLQALFGGPAPWMAEGF